MELEITVSEASTYIHTYMHKFIDLWQTRAGWLEVWHSG